LNRRYKCFKCKKTFNDLTGTIFSNSRISLWKWLYTVFEFSQKKAISAKELHEKIGVSYPTALKMLRKIRAHLLEMTEGVRLEGTVEADEAWTTKVIIQGIVEREGKLTIEIIDNLKEATLQKQIRDKVERGSKIITDDRIGYYGLQIGYEHEKVNHSQTFVNPVNRAHTNTIEGVWSHLKRLLGTIYHGVWKKYLKYYLAEFVYRYNYRNVPNLFSHLTYLIFSPRYCLY